MRVCPVCKNEYDEDVQVCPEDGEQLIEGGESLPENPELASVVEVSPDEATAMVDLESLQPVIAERLSEREDRVAAQRLEEADRLRQAAIAADPDATGTHFQPDLGSLHGGDLNASDEDDDFDPGVDATALSLPSGDRVESAHDHRGSPTQRIKRAPGGSDEQSPVRSNRSNKKLLLLAALGGFGLLVLGAGGFALWYNLGPRGGETLTVTTAPPGAKVHVDGKFVGQAPVQLRVKAGSHTIELSLAGYEPFKEVVMVKKGEGLPFLQPLKAIAGYTPPVDDSLSADAGSVDGGGRAGPDQDRIETLIARVEGYLKEANLEGALAEVKELLKSAPDDPRVDVLFDRVTAARMASLTPRDKRDRRGRRGARGRNGRRADASATNTGDDSELLVGLNGLKSLPKAERKTRGAKAYQDGERFFRGGRLADAKRSFRRSVQLDPQFALPHRSVARIYQREGKKKKARYHLKRYLKLDGADPDFKVRRWLEQNQ